MFNLFKAPPFGLDISDRSIEAVSLAGTAKNPRLSAMARLAMEQGLVENGEVLDKEKLAQLLRGLIKAPQFGEFKTRKIIFSLPESRGLIHVFDIPAGLKKEELPETIKNKAEEIFPYPLAELCLDYKIKKMGEGREILLAAVPKKMVNDYLEIFGDCQLKPVVLEIESEGLARSLGKEERGSYLLADIGDKITNLNIFDENGLRTSISLDIAGNKLSRVLAEKLAISYQEAEDLKNRVGLNPDVKEGRVFLILQNEIQKIISEIEKINHYYQEKTAKKIGKLILAGGSAALPRLSEYLTENLKIPVVVGDPWLKIDIDILRKKAYFKKALEINPLFYATAIGSALRGLSLKTEENGLNFLP